MPNLDQLRRRADPLSRAYCGLADALVDHQPDVALDARDWATNLEDNLIGGLRRTDLEADFGSAAGKELDTKMKAPWSSSALVVNAFWPWKRAARELVIKGVRGYSDEFLFEAQCPNGVSAIPPHLDVLLEHGDTVVGIESKCTEFLSPKTAKVSSAYLNLASRNDPRASSQWFAVLHHADDFRHLDAYQLVKHYLGLRLEYPSRPLVLTYMYWEPANSDAMSVFEHHRREIHRFAEIVDGDSSCDFVSLSYPEHWRELESSKSRPEWMETRLRELRARYLIDI